MIRETAHNLNGSAGFASRLVAAVLLLAPFVGVHADEAALTTGSPRTESLAAGQSRTYRVSLERGQAAELSVRQLGAHALALRWDSDDALLHTEAGRAATLRLTLIADTKTAWDITVAPVDTGSESNYSIALASPHPAAKVDRDRAAAIVALAKAEALRGKGDKASMPSARALYQTSIKNWQAASDGCGARHAYVALSGFEHDSVDAAGQMKAAQAALAQACEGDIAEQALAARLLGSAFINQGDFAQGTRATERAVALFGETGDTYQQGIAQRNLGLAYAESGEMEKALATTHSALKAAETVQDAKLLALVRNDIAFMHNARGEFALAVDAYRQTLDALKSAPYPMAEAVAWINLGIAYSQLGDIEQAFAAYAKGEAAATAIDCWSCLAEIEVDRGDDLLDAGDVVKAEAAYQRALDIAKAHQLVRQRAEALRGLGRCAMAAQKWPEARALLESARAELHRTHGRVNESVVYAMLGDLENRLNNLDAARRNYRQALALAKQADNQGWQALAYASLARVAEQSGKLDEAQRAIEQAIALIESERTRINAPDLRTSYFGTKRSYYGLYIDVLMQLDRRHPDAGHAAQALIVAERARARQLQDQLAERAIDVDQDIDPALIADERGAEDALHALAYQLSQAAAGDTARRATLQGQIDEASRRLDEVRGRIRAANPRYAELTHPAALRLDEIQRDLIGENASVLEYWLGEQQSYLWLATRDAVRAFVLPPGATIEKSADALREKLLARTIAPASRSMEQWAAYDAAEIDAVGIGANALADQILPADVRASLRGDVAIVADGGLQALPFALLLGESRKADAAFVAHVDLPSIGALRGLRALARSTASPKSLAIVADPVFRVDDPRLNGRAAATPESADALLLRAANEAGIATLSRLPHTRQEAEAIAALADRGASWIALDFAANRAAALDAAWKNYAILHFATHALLNARHPELSGIVLSLYDEGGRAEDGFLRVNDIYNLHMPADLVVLSVCESAVGQSVGAEGASNLARAFFHAGARRVVASLWPVDDRASVEFMRAFYSALLEHGRRPQDALVDAQGVLRMNPRWRAPYYWSGYVLQGDWR